MQYETFIVIGAEQPAPYGRYVNVVECADKISGIYERVAEHGGEIIAGHTLDCDIDTTLGSVREVGRRESTRLTTLFLVAEFSDDVDTSEIPELQRGDRERPPSAS